MDQDITFYDKLQIKRDLGKPKTTFYDYMAKPINLEFMKDQPNETPIKRI